jgi:hypothetical protein
MSSRVGLTWVLALGAVLGVALSGPKSPRSAHAVETAVRRVQGQPCGGLAGSPCPEGYTCVDDPRDDCDPTRNGADCIGWCMRARPGPSRCTGREPGRRYLSHDVQQCAAIRFACEAGMRPFFDACGCGCEPES